MALRPEASDQAISGAISYAWNIPLMAGRVGLSEEELRQAPMVLGDLGAGEASERMYTRV